MYQLLALITGLAISVMVSINGNLSQQHGTYIAVVIIHFVGSLFALLLCGIIKEKRASSDRIPIWFYLGGAIGVLTTLFNNFAFGHISMTSIVALGLLGQTVTSLIIDALGLFGMQKRPFKKSSVIGLTFALVGIALMLDSSVTQAVYAVLYSLGAGVTVVLSRSVNARLSTEIGAMRGTLINHLVGLPITVIIALIAYKSAPATFNFQLSPEIWIYMGGILGVTAVFLSNITVLKVSAFALTVLVFVGQFFAGVILDIASGVAYFDSSFIGGIIIALGIAAMILTDYTSKKPRVSGDK